jgi:UTP:GlnB (protein PII) uridylyltransferase
MALAHLTEGERRCLERYLAHLVDGLGAELEEVTVFGSAARGDMWPPSARLRSDIDLLVVTSSRVTERVARQLVDATYPHFLECGRQIAPQFRTADEVAGAFAEELARDGVTLWLRGVREAG